MKHAYLDCSSGISGDMFMAALLDAGLDAQLLLGELKKIPLGEFQLRTSRVLRGGISGNRVEIEAPAKQPHRHLSHIEKLLEEASIQESVKQKARQIFRRLGAVEAKLHNKTIEQIHFHEVGAVDAILDVVGVCAGLEMLGIERLISSPLNVGSGRVEAAHGSLPVPAPATAELLKGIPVYSTGVEGELVTPTGAALVSTLASGFGSMPAMKVDAIGYGAGTKDFATHPNIARLFTGEFSASTSEIAASAGEEIISVIEANVDDMIPQLYGYFSERALAAGALDVTCTPTQMKKNRPGMLVSVLAKPENCNMLIDLLFAETTTIGVRIHEVRRTVLDREVVMVETPYGPVRVKIARRDGKIVNVAPEYDDCQQIAREKDVPLKQVMLAAQIAFTKQGKFAAE